MTSKTWRPIVAELVATTLFVFFGAGSVVMSAGSSGPAGLLTVAFANGIAMAILVTATLPISGGHLNPAITVGLWVAGKVDARRAGSFVIAQLVGGVLAGVLIKVLLPAAAVNVASAGTPTLATSVTFLQGVWIEAVLTFFLLSAVFGTVVSSEAPAVGGFAVGLAVFVATVVAGPLTGAAVNPARALGPAVVTGELHGQAVYWIGPLLGGIAAAVLWRWVLLPRDPAAI